jgi:hypothetical protein
MSKRWWNSPPLARTLLSAHRFKYQYGSVVLTTSVGFIQYSLISVTSTKYEFPNYGINSSREAFRKVEWKDMGSRFPRYKTTKYLTSIDYFGSGIGFEELGKEMKLLNLEVTSLNFKDRNIGLSTERSVPRSLIVGWSFSTNVILACKNIKNQ